MKLAHRFQCMRREGAERGFTLIELLVYMIIFLMVVAMVATILIKMLQVQRDVTGSAYQNMDQQSVFADLSRTVRNSSGVDVRFNGQVMVTDNFVGDLESVVGVAPGAAGNLNDPSHWTCRAWYYDAAAETLYQTYEEDKAKAASAGTATLASIRSAATSGAGWREVLTGVTPANGQVMFSVIKNSPPASPDLVLDGHSLSFNSGEARTSDRVWVSIIGETVAQPLDQYQIKFDTKISLRTGGAGMSSCRG